MKMKHNKLLLKREISYEILILPALAGYIIFFAYPYLSSFFYGFTDWSQVNRQWSFIGLQNYRELFQDTAILTGIKNSITYAFLMTILQNALAIPLAVILDMDLKTKNFLRMVFFAPAVLSILVVGFLWSFIMSPTDYGLLNSLIHQLGLPKVNWLGEPKIALYSILLTQLWQWTGWAMVIYVANLQSIPNELYEASRIDGAGSWRVFYSITLPMLVPSFTVNSISSMIGGLKLFDIVFAMTGGGPGHATETMITMLIKRGLNEGNYGYASAFSVVFFIFIMAISAIQLKFLQKWEDKVS